MPLCVTSKVRHCSFLHGVGVCGQCHEHPGHSMKALCIGIYIFSRAPIVNQVIRFSLTSHFHVALWVCVCLCRSPWARPRLLVWRVQASVTVGADVSLKASRPLHESTVYWNLDFLQSTTCELSYTFLSHFTLPRRTVGMCLCLPQSLGLRAGMPKRLVWREQANVTVGAVGAEGVAPTCLRQDFAR